MMRTMVIGGTRSGKSTYAESLAKASGKQLIYVATSEAGDDEMMHRIVHHRARRDAAWVTLEEPIALAAIIEQHSTPDSVLLIDCLTVWLSNLLFSEAMAFPEIGIIEPPAIFHTQSNAFFQALASARGDIVLVTNEVGQGVVPTGAISRWFVDESGRMNQAVAALCDRVVLVTAGLPLTLKGG
ncbi:bifunctional adenosylcobinamide kinase/adenosylcobinamide-phosphate guanylyltransferase [Oxalicibacterium faecigallinarum]|nr:bifunctional adenosylcobinamide kinase/adenosylcobinamide-phosphate guanylyltransferase [Oxalicibacterium faecigallinarum]